MFFEQHIRQGSGQNTPPEPLRINIQRVVQKGDRHPAILLMQRLFPNLDIPANLITMSQNDLLVLHDLLIEINRLRHRIGKIETTDPFIYGQLNQLAYDNVRRVRETLQ